LKWHFLLFDLVLTAATFLPAASGVKAQGVGIAPIRVESNEVLVPVFVWNKKRWDELWGKTPSNPALYQDAVIRNLASGNFQIFEDDKEQTIQRVALESPSVSLVRDSIGLHYEHSTGIGRWSFPDLQREIRPVLAWPTYLLAYSPPQSREGSCHHVKVTVSGAPDAGVLARSEYCKTKFSEVDPLIGSKFGKLMEDDLVSTSNGKIPLLLTATAAFADSKNSRVHIGMEFPPQSLRYKLQFGTSGQLYESIGMLGRIYAKNGTLAARFSDFDCCDYSNGAAPDWLMIGTSGPVDILFAPSAYETQVYLPPGDYVIWVVLSDGVDFGRAEMPLTVEGHDMQPLALSDIVLAKRSRPAPAVEPEESAKLMGKYVPLISGGTQFMASANSSFQKHKPLYVYFEVFQPIAPGSPPPSVEAHLRIVVAATGKLEYGPADFSAAPYTQEGDPVISIARTIDIHKLPSGSFRLEVQATNSSGRSTPWRAANFTLN
jgi:hypothetical protein